MHAVRRRRPKTWLSTSRELGVPLAQIAFAMCVSRQRASRMAMDHSEARRELVGEIVQSLRSDLDAVR
jgi:hypothetical protein